MTLTEFVTARLGEEQRKAEQGAGGRHDHLDRDNYGFLWADPARVLAQVAAMRAVVEDCADYIGSEAVTDGLSLRTLRHLAAVWSDHDQYDPAWAPEGE